MNTREDMQRPDFELILLALDSAAALVRNAKYCQQINREASKLRAWLAAHPAAGAVVVDEAAVSRLADFIEDRPAYICLPDDERKRIAREYLTAAIGGQP